MSARRDTDPENQGEEKRENEVGEELEGIVEEMLPNAQFAVRLKDGRVLRAMVARQVRAFIVKLTPGDAVTVTPYKYDPTRGTILKKMKPLSGGRGSAPLVTALAAREPLAEQNYRLRGPTAAAAPRYNARDSP
jgi:translation initiation factor IF-1